MDADAFISDGVFVLSLAIHMVFGYHASDYKLLPEEDRILEFLRSIDIPPGDYMAPFPKTRDEWKTPEFQKKMEGGPIFFMTMFTRGKTRMGENMVL